MTHGKQQERQSPDGRLSRKAVSVLAVLALTALIAGCKDTARDLAGGNQIDALQRAKTAAAGASQQGEQRFKEGLKAGASDSDIEAATGEPAP